MKITKHEGKDIEIRFVAIAVPADRVGEADDEISVILSENGMFNPASTIIDWRYMGGTKVVPTSAPDLIEDELFWIPIIDRIEKQIIEAIEEEVV